MIVDLMLDLCIGYTIAHAATNLIGQESFAARVTHLKTEYLKIETEYRLNKEGETLEYSRITNV